jgi:hypothetical protein
VRTALAIPVVVAVLCTAAAADPAPPPAELPHVVTAPTAWLPAAGTVIGMAGLDHTGEPLVDVAYGMGGLAALDVGVDTDVEATAGSGAPTSEVALGRAGFRMGLQQELDGLGALAELVGARVTFAGSGRRVTDVYAVASARLGAVRVHLGADVMDAKASSGATPLGTTLRPTLGVEVTPPIYPRTTLLVDLAWLPKFDGATTEVQYVAGFGVRYQALKWGAIELDVRTREGEGLGDTKVMVRVDGVWK